MDPLGQSRRVADTLADPPSAGDALDAAHGLLEDAGLVDDRWDAFVTEPSTIPAPCRPDLVTSFDCNQQLLATRSVHLSLRVGPGTTELRWGVVVGPGPTVYVATGRALARPE